ncbi:hypothetical protein BC826DRAFT_142784 [Russula brevipes]|nr:hypothetical protein BC826DRAFT_142784 [Russula brevipes]
MDTFIFLLLLYKAVKIGRGVRLLNVIIRNGTIYYTVLSFTNLTNILVLRFAPPPLRTTSTGFTNALSSTLISRVILNLRAASRSGGVIFQPSRPTWQGTQTQDQNDPHGERSGAADDDTTAPSPWLSRPAPPPRGSGVHVGEGEEAFSSSAALVHQEEELILLTPCLPCLARHDQTRVSFLDVQSATGDGVLVMACLA